MYDDVEQPYPDAKVAEKLSIGAACFYIFPYEDANVNGGVIYATIGNNMEMLMTFVLTQVLPNIQHCVPESCAVVLGKGFLWFIYCDDAVSENFLPEEFKSQIKLELNEILTASGMNVEVNNFNPICRVPVIVMGDQGSVFIDRIEAEDQEGHQVRGGGAIVGGVLGPGGRPTGGMNAQLMAVHSLATQFCCEIHEIKLAQVADRAAMQRCFGIVNTSLRRIGMAPAFQIAQGGGVGAGHDDSNTLAEAGLQNLARVANASLSPCPRNLYDLWTEYTVGLGGRKPASQLSHIERGKSKHKFFVAM
jgi:hypothetical protein